MDSDTDTAISETADEWFARVTQGLEKTSSAYKKYQEEYNAWVGENNEALIEWAGNNADKIKDVEANYKAYAEAVNSGAIDYDDTAITQMQNQL
ncbi:MAG: hypothetical protein IKY94_15205 [Lachnospiraceae bacterium]|nr:hypothetical protein [Lachnospiraceae bacterium]